MVLGYREIMKNKNIFLSLLGKNARVSLLGHLLPCQRKHTSRDQATANCQFPLQNLQYTADILATIHNSTLNSLLDCGKLSIILKAQASLVMLIHCAI